MRLEELGRSHQRRNINRSHVETFRDVLLLTLQRRLNCSKTSKTITAWNDIAQYCIDSMYNTTYQFYRVRSGSCDSYKIGICDESHEHKDTGFLTGEILSMLTEEQTLRGNSDINSCYISELSNNCVSIECQEAIKLPSEKLELNVVVVDIDVEGPMIPTPEPGPVLVVNHVDDEAEVKVALCHDIHHTAEDSETVITIVNEDAIEVSPES